MGDMSREPSMEEILSSIRRVIARDDPSLKAGGRPLSPMSQADLRALDDLDTDQTDDGDEDILELTEAEMPIVPSADQQDDSTAMPAKASPVVVDTPAPELVSPLSAAASRSSLDVLAAVLASGKDDGTAAVTPGGDVSVNALVEAALRPMLRQWLDANLPGIVEALVAKEIARITGTRG